MRKLNNKEMTLIKLLLNESKVSYAMPVKIEDLLVIDLDDGGMGSMRFKLFDDYKEYSRKFGRAILEATLANHSGKKVFVELSVDEQGLLFELDSFTGDFQPLGSPLNADNYTIIGISSPPQMESDA